jgi:protein phosphatase
MDNGKGEFKVALDAFLGAMSSDVNKYATHQIPLALPNLESQTCVNLFREAQAIFKAESVLLEVESPCVIVGDLHGQILDLIRILSTFGLPSRQRYIFLGDLVDRGEFSIETLVVVLLLKVLWPENVFLIRGNHEFDFLCAHGGYQSQVVEMFGDQVLYQASIQMFGFIPLAARIDNVILCVHGGIGPELTDVNVINSVFRPVDTFGQDAVDSLVWSDPADNIAEFEASASRGTGYNFGAAAARRFMTESGLKLIVRAHECVNEGYQWHFNKEVMTVFSASNYCGLVGNYSAVLEVITPDNVKPHQFPPLQWLCRREVNFGQRQNALSQLRTAGSKQTLKVPLLAKLKGQAVSSSCRGLPRLMETSLTTPDFTSTVDAPMSSMSGLPHVQFNSKRRKTSI